jgi:hypothetical protein
MLASCSAEPGARDNAADAEASDEDAGFSDDPESGPACEPYDADGGPLRDDAGACTVEHVDVHIVDDRGFPLLADALMFQIPGCADPVPCRSPGSSTVFFCDIPAEAAADARVALIAEQDGKQYRREATLEWRGYPPDQWNYCVESASVSLPLPACADRDATAIEGRVLGVAEDADLHVTLLKPYEFDGDVFYLLGQRVECAIDGATYRCPAIGYRQSYLLWVTDGERIIAQRDVHVQIDGCTIKTSRYDVRPDACDVELWLDAEATALQNAEVTVRFDPGDGERAVVCERPNSDQSLIRCPLPAMSPVPRQISTIETSTGTVIGGERAAFRSRQCPAILAGTAAGLPQSGLMRLPIYGVPNLVLTAEDLKTLGLAE